MKKKLNLLYLLCIIILIPRNSNSQTLNNPTFTMTDLCYRDGTLCCTDYFDMQFSIDYDIPIANNPGDYSIMFNIQILNGANWNQAYNTGCICSTGCNINPIFSPPLSSNQGTENGCMVYDNVPLSMIGSNYRIFYELWDNVNNVVVDSFISNTLVLNAVNTFTTGDFNFHYVTTPATGASPLMGSCSNVPIETKYANATTDVDKIEIVPTPNTLYYQYKINGGAINYGSFGGPFTMGNPLETVNVTFPFCVEVRFLDYCSYTWSPWVAKQLTCPWGQDLIISDGNPDNGIEPSLSANIWAGDIWNCHNNNNCLVEENPVSQSVDYMQVKVRNVGCIASQPANLHMYWTRGATQEMWKESWFDPSVEPNNVVFDGTNYHPNGGEITVTGVSTPNPIIIPPILPGNSLILTKSWTVPNKAWFPFISGTDQNPINPMICFLGRIVSPFYDPMNNETFPTPIGTNVVNNNNVATRNSFIINGPTVIDRSVVMDGSISVYNPRTEILPVEGIRITGINTNDIGTSKIDFLEIQLEPNLYTRWVKNGRKGLGIRDMGKNRIRILDYNLAEIRNVQVLPREKFNIVPVVSYKLNTGLSVKTRLHSFKINHYYRDNRTGSAGIYHIDFNPRSPVQNNISNDNKNSSASFISDDIIVNGNESGIFNIKLLTDFGKNIIIKLYDLNGKTLSTEEIDLAASNTITFDSKIRSTGMYILNLTNENINKSIKVFIK
jgi:hypothetical protein